MPQTLNPLTNLPKETQPNTDPSSRLAAMNKSIISSEGSPVAGARGKYDPDLLVVSDKNFDEWRAQGQTIPQIMGRSFMQALGVAVGGTIEGVGFMYDLPQHMGALIKGGEMEFERNLVSQAGKDIQDHMFENYEVFQTEDAQSGTMSRFMDATYWGSHMPSIVSTVSLMIPAMGVAAGLRGTAAMLNLSRGASQAVTTLGTAIASRHNYGLLESYDVHEQRMQKLTEEDGLPYQEAKAGADGAAADNYRVGYVNLWKDTLQWGALLRGLNYANRAQVGSITKGLQGSKLTGAEKIRNSLLRNPTQSLKDAVRKADFSWKDYLLQAGLEGYEEFNIQFQKNWAMRNSDILMGLTDGDTKGFLESYFSEDMKEHVGRAETWDATLFGFLGGAIFQGIGSVATRGMNRGRAAAQLAEMEKLEAHIDQMQNRLQAIDRFLKEGDGIAAEEQFKMMIKDLTVSGFRHGDGTIVGSAQEGTLGNTREMFEGVSQLTDQEIQELGLGDPANVREQAKKALVEINKVEEIYNRNAEKVHGTPIDEVINVYLSEQEYINEITKETISQYSNEIIRLYEDSATQQLIKDLDGGKREYLSKTRELTNLQQVKRIFEGEIADTSMSNAYTLPIRSKVRQKTLEKLNEKITQLETDISDAQGPEGLSKKDQTEVSNISKTLSKNEDLSMAEFSKLFREFQLQEGEIALGEFLKEENQTFLLNAIRKKEEDLKADLEKFIVEQIYKEDSFVEKDGQYYQLIKDDAGNYTIVPVDQQLNYIPGKEATTVTDFGDLIDNYKKQEFESVLSQEDYEKELARVEKNIQDGSIIDAIRILDEVIRKSNYRNKLEEGTKLLIDTFSDYISKIDSTEEIGLLNRNLLDYLPRDQVFRAFRPIMMQRLEQIKKQAEVEVEAFYEILTEKRNEASDVLKQLKETEGKISEITSQVDKFKQKLRDTAERKNRTQKSILETHYALRRDLNEAISSTAKNLTSLKELRRKLRRQQKDIDKSLTVYEALVDKLLKARGTLPSVLIQSELAEFTSVADQIRAETLFEFNLTDYGLKKLQREYLDSIATSNTLENFLQNITTALGTLGRANNQIIAAAERAFVAVREENNIESDEHVFSNSELERFFQLLNREITKEAEKADTAIGRILINAMRLSSADQQTIENFLTKEIPKAAEIAQQAEKLRANLPAIQTYEQVIQAMKEAWEIRSISVPPKTEGKPATSSGEYNNPKRHPENVFNRLAGDSGDTETGLTKDPVQRRYARFVSSHNINELASAMQLQFMTPEQAGVSLKGLPDFYDPAEVIYAAITDKDGNYYKEDGTITTKFNPDENIYTTVPLASFHSHRMSKTYQFSDDGKLLISDEQLKELYPGEKNLASARMKLENYLNTLKDQHEEFRTELKEQLATGEPVYRPLIGKSNGVPNEIKYKEGQPKKLTTLFDKGLMVGESPIVEIGVSTSGLIDSMGETIAVRKGNPYIRDTRTGNIYPAYRRNLTKQEVDTVVNALKYVIANSQTAGKKKIDTKVAIEGLTKTLKGNIEPVYFNNIIRRYVYAFSEKSDIRFEQSNIPGGELTIQNTLRDENGNITGEELNTYTVFAQKDGAVIKKINPELEAALRKKLSTMPMQVSSAGLKNNDSYQQYMFKDGEFIQKEYTSYRDYVVDNEVVGHFMKELGDVSVVEGGTEVGTTKDISHYNQNIYYDNRTQEQIDNPKAAEPEVKKAEQQDANAEGLAELRAAASTQEEALRMLRGETTGDPIEQLRKSKPETTGEEADAAARWSKAKGESTETEGFEIDWKYEDKDPDNLRAPFQRQSSSRLLSSKQVDRIAKSLSERTGLNVVVLNEDSSFLLLENLRDQGVLTETFTRETVPHGMYHNGIAYVFNVHGIRADTPFHEVTHPIISQIISDNPELFKTLKSEIESTPAGRKIKDRIINHYPNPIGVDGNLTINAWAEVITTAIGEQAADNIVGKANESLVQAVQRIWTQIIEYIKNLIGREAIDISSLPINTTISDIAFLLSYSKADINITPTLVPQYQRGSVFDGTIGALNNLPGKDSLFTQDAMKLMDFVFFQALFKKHSNLIPALFSGEGLSKENYQRVMESTRWGVTQIGNSVNSRFLVQPTSENATYLNNYSYIRENFDTVQQMYEKYLVKYNLESITSELFTESNEKDGNQLWQIEGLKYSSKQNSTSDIRMLVASLSTRKPHNETFNTRENADFGTAFSLLANQLAGTTELSQMKKIVETTLKDRDGMQDLVERVFNKFDNISTVTTAEAHTLLQFRKTFAKNFNKYGIMFSGEKGYKLIDANATTAARRLVEKWQANISPKKGSNFKVANDQIVYDLKSMKDKGLFDSNSLSQANRYLPPQAVSLPAVEQGYIKAVNFLKELGIEITTDVVPSSGQFSARVSVIYDSMKKTTSETYQNILSAESNHKENLYDYIIPHEITNSLDAKENSHVRPSGENIYNVNLYSYLTYIANKINTSRDLGTLLQNNPHLNTPYQESSLILNRKGTDGKRGKVFNKKGERVSDVDIVFVDSYIQEGTRESDTFARLSHMDQTLITLNGALNNTFPSLRAGDNSNERHIRFPEFFTDGEAVNGDYAAYLQDYLIDEVKEVQRIIESDDKFLNVPDSILKLLEKFPISRMMSSNPQLQANMLAAVAGDMSQIGAAQSLALIKLEARKYISDQVTQTINYLINKDILVEDGAMYQNKGLLGITRKSEKIRPDIVQRQLSKALVNRLFANVEQTKLWISSPAYYKNADELFKRMSAVVGTKDTAAVGHVENQLIDNHFARKNSNRLYKNIDEHGVLSEESTEYSQGSLPILRTSVFNDVKVTSSVLESLAKNIRDQYKNMEETDAIGFISMDGYRDFLLRTGNWDMYKERLYQWVTKSPTQINITFENWYTGEKEVIYNPKQLVNADGSRTVFNMIKPQYFGPLAEEGFVPAMYKTAWIPVLPSYSNRPALKQITDFQNNFNIDLVTFVSANKIGAKLGENNKLAEIYKDGVVDFDQATIQDTFFEYWGNQLDTGKKVKDTVVKGSQMVKLMDANIYDNGLAVNEELAELAGHMRSINNALIDKGITELKKRLDIAQDANGNYSITDVRKLMDFLEGEARKRDANSNVLDSLEMMKNYWEHTDLGLDIMSNRDKIENILAAIADSMVISQKMPGGSKVQAPVTFFEDSLYTNVKDGKRIYNKQGELLSGTLKFYEDGTMEVLLPHHFKEIFSELTASEIDERLRKGVAFRIPTSGLNSIEHIKVVGYLPQEAGETVIVPSEIVTKAGSDFDVDKLNIYLPNYEIVDGQPQYVEFDSSISVEKNSRQQLENRLIETMGKIISHPNNREQLLEPIGISLIREQENRIVKKLGLSTAEKSMLDVVGNFSYYMDVTRRNLESIRLTGVAALHTADHSHASRYGYKMNEKHQIMFEHNNEDGLIQLGKIYNVDGVKISSLLNQLVNAAVDGAKEPIFFNLNLNLETADTVFYLVRAGVSLNDVFDLLNSPIVRLYTERENIRNSITETDLQKKDSKKAATDAFPGQQEILEEYLTYKESAQIINNYIQGTRMDTQAMGRNTSELDIILESAQNIYAGKSGIINAEKLLQRGGFLNRHYEALLTINDMYSKFFISKSDPVGKVAYEQMLKYVAPKMTTLDNKVKVLDKVKSDFITATVLNAPIKIGKAEYGPIKDDFSLIIGDNTVAKLLQKEQAISDNPLVHQFQPIIGKYKYKILGQDTFIDGVKMFDQRLDTVDTNTAIDHFRELFLQNPVLAAGLVRLAFLQGGLQLNPMSYIKIIPAEIYMQVLDTAFKNRAPMTASNFIQRFVTANYNDPNIVPTAWGRRGTTSPIYKRFKKLNLPKAELDSRKELNQPTIERTPTVYINLKMDREGPNLFTSHPSLSEVSGSVAEIQVNSIRDNRNNVNFVYYGSDITVTTERAEVQLGDATTTRQEARELTKYCKS